MAGVAAGGKEWPAFNSTEETVIVSQAQLRTADVQRQLQSLVVTYARQ
jgi:hypothetical protein